MWTYHQGTVALWSQYHVKNELFHVWHISCQLYGRASGQLSTQQIPMYNSPGSNTTPPSFHSGTVVVRASVIKVLRLRDFDGNGLLLSKWETLHSRLALTCIKYLSCRVIYFSYLVHISYNLFPSCCQIWTSQIVPTMCYHTQNNYFLFIYWVSQCYLLPYYTIQ